MYTTKQNIIDVLLFIDKLFDATLLVDTFSMQYLVHTTSIWYITIHNYLKNFFNHLSVENIDAMLGTHKHV